MKARSFGGGRTKPSFGGGGTLCSSSHWPLCLRTIEFRVYFLLTDFLQGPLYSNLPDLYNIGHESFDISAEAFQFG